MILNYIDDSPEGIKRKELIKSILPEQPFTCTILEPAIKRMFPTIVRCIRAELEVYRAHRKRL